MKRKILIAAAVIAVLFGVVWLFAPETLRQPNTSSGEVPVSGTPVPAQLPASELPPSAPQAPPSKATENQGKSKKPDQDAAAKAAAEAVQALASAQFVPELYRRDLLKSVVVPSRHEAWERLLTLAAPGMAQWYGFSSVADAQARSNFRVVPSKYKVIRFGGGRAVLLLYQIEYFNTGSYPAQEAGAKLEPNRQYGVPQIQVIEMRLVDGKWLYFGDRVPTKAQSPPPIEDLTFQQAESQFLPYLRGFKDL